MKRFLLVLIAALAMSLFSASSAPASSWSHPGWQKNPHNPHYIVTRPPLGHCDYVIGVCTN
jgi:hypothetical protein